MTVYRRTAIVDLNLVAHFRVVFLDELRKLGDYWERGSWLEYDHHIREYWTLWGR